MYWSFQSRSTRFCAPRRWTLFSLAVSAVNGCEACVRAHEQVVTAGGLTEDAVHDAIRIASVVHAAAVALETRN